MSYFLDDTLCSEAKKELFTVVDWLRWCTSRLDESEVYFGHGTDNPWDEAVALVLQSLRLPFDCPDSLYHARLTTREKELILERMKLRINQRTPLAYLTHEAYFCGLPFYVDDRVLVPRSPIAELIEQHFEAWVQEPSTILDLCTGSGCIAVACAHYFPNVFVTATDLSEDALDVATINVQHHQVDDRVCLLQSDGFSQIPQQTFDLIVSNPPYVDAEDMSDLPDEFLKEPELGLASGKDGLDLTHRIIQEASQYLSEQGVLIVEVGNSWPALADNYPQLAFEWIQFERGGDGVFALTRQQLVDAGF
ncbi:50S ribosomal protein L3 N(5)-glutamine methyltransferase [Pleionea sediminis]|uniref:50S ribosomal protein L3 N(5)-glutamine methyltransferase n=1 Tax=Pleionea sediminis TaxID=2569479 RepID=UPI0011870CE0|nr:50S ribosomal protein L3 N(5)-glutamine methyltransferase [Pleionea sediminis]